MRRVVQSVEGISAGRQDDPSSTPAMRQWTEQKAQAGDALLLFRMGDFYETFHDDARTVARELGLTLTARSKGENPIPLAGIPHHALDHYLPRLVRAGFSVAISEQTEDPRQAKGVVRREIVRVITPGTLTDDHLLDDTAVSYLAAIHGSPPGLGAACLDLAGGEFFTLQDAAGRMLDELLRLRPAEVLISAQAGDAVLALSQRLEEEIAARVVRREAQHFDPSRCRQRLLQQLQVQTLEGFGYAEIDAGVQAAGAILGYLQETQKCSAGHIRTLRRREADDHVHIDASTWRSLEIERTLRSGRSDGSLAAAVDRTMSAMGARQLRGALRFPLCRAGAIRERQAAVAALRQDQALLRALRQALGDLCDVQRVTGRLGVRRCTPRDLGAVRRSLGHIRTLGQRLDGSDCPLLERLARRLDGVPELEALLSAALSKDPPPVLREGGVIAGGYDAELDRLRSLARDGRSWLAQYQAREIERTGIPSLKVGFNKVFGYYIEVTHSHRQAIPADYVRKQTLKGAERYITEPLKCYENEALTAQQQAQELEGELFNQLLDKAARFIPALLETADAAGQLDMLCSMAQWAGERRCVRPELSDSDELIIAAGRHPVLDQTLGRDLVPNDTSLTPADERLLLITGPNMAGKSTYIRQVALLALLAHTGSFVPAEAMSFAIMDRIFARVGASDEIMRGQSTFMVEMIEAAHILNNATSRSLVILDELGRGTSTYDGLSLAWAICEDLACRVRCRTLFATHYHELTELASLLPGVRNYNVAVREWPQAADEQARIVFLHRIVPGGTDKSYGVHVAQIAGVPPGVVQRSREVLQQLESGLSRSSLRQALGGRAAAPEQQLELFGAQDDRLRQALLALDVDGLTPLQALMTLKELQDQAKGTTEC
jgi:DNA mismatch repair protein MutS